MDYGMYLLKSEKNNINTKEAGEFYEDKAWLCCNIYEAWKENNKFKYRDIC